MSLRTLVFTIALIASGQVQATSLEELIDIAVANDPLIVGSRAAQSAYAAEAVAAGELPDPRLTVSMMNLPVDTFDFSQEPMTQVHVGLSQVFPRAAQRELMSRRYEINSDISAIARQLRAALIRRDLSLTWFDAMLAQRKIDLIEAERPLFEQLVDVIKARFRAASKGVNKQDMVQAELQLINLQERILKTKETLVRRQDQLRQWVPEVPLETIGWRIPGSFEPVDSNLLLHPEITTIDYRISVKQTEAALANERKKPGWMLTTSYGYRDEDRFGNDLADFFSVGVSVDLPLFKENRQDKQVQAATDRVTIIKNERLNRLRQLHASLDELVNGHAQLIERNRLYTDSLLPQLDRLTQAALDAYTTDAGDFTDVVSAHVALLNARIEQAHIETEILKVRAKLQYLTTTIDGTQT